MMMTTAEIQAALKALGYDPGPLDGKPGPKTTAAVKHFQQDNDLVADGVFGPKTQAALLAAVEPHLPPVQGGLTRGALVPSPWLPNVKMKGVVFHWTGGAYKAGGLEKSRYHIIIEGGGNLVRGVDIVKNAAPLSEGYAAHTKGHNTGIIGVSLACMAGAKESPFNAGSAPMTPAQWAALPPVLADLCRIYRISPTRQNVLSHAEVQSTLGIKQNGKWDVAWVPGMLKPGDAHVLGDQVRSAVARLI